MIRKLITPPRFEDPETNRQVWLLNAVIWPLLGVAVALLIGLTFAGATWIVLTAVILFMALVVVVIFLMRHERVQAACKVFAFGGWLVITTPAFLQDGLASTFLFYSLVMIVLGSLLLERRYVQILTMLGLAAAAVLLVNMEYPLFRQVIPTSSPLRRFLGVAGALVAISIILQMTMRNVRSALEAAEMNRKSTEEANRLLQEAKAVLERRVSERTALLEARARQIQASSEVAAAAVSIRDLDVLLSQITGLISEQFGYYYVGIYLLDQETNILELRAANTPAGIKLIQRGFSLTPDQASMAVFTAQNRQVRVAADVSVDAVYLPLDEFTKTRSEITLPLLYADKLFGVLDLQDSRVRAPSSDELAALRMLSNQIAIALDNAQLFAASQRSLETLQKAYGTMSQEGWQKVLQAHADLGFHAGESGTPTPVSGDWLPEMAQAQASGKIVKSDPYTLAVPIRIRNQTTGVVRLVKPTAGGEWHSDEVALVETLSDRLSAALENARLFEETRRRAERERLTGEITARMRASNDAQTILQVAALELRKALQADKAQLVVQAVPVNGGGDGWEPNRQDGFPVSASDRSDSGSL